MAEKPINLIAAAAVGYLIGKKTSGPVSGIGAISLDEIQGKIDYLNRAYGTNMQLRRAYGKYSVSYGNRGTEFSGYLSKNEMAVFLRGLDMAQDLIGK